MMGSMMKSMVKYMGTVAVVIAMLAAGSCTKETGTVLPQDGVTFNEDGTMNVTVGMLIPGMTAASTRALTAEPNFSVMHLYLLMFEKNNDGAYQLRQLEEFAPGDEGYSTGQNDDEHGHGDLVKYKVALEPTDREVVVHLIATDQPDFGTNINFGLEESVITSLYTSYTNAGASAEDLNGADFHGAYWQRVDVGCRIPSKEQITDEQSNAITTALSHVPLVRNFCRVSVRVEGQAAQNFTLTGLYVLNTVDQGSVAPYMADQKKFVEYYKAPNAGKTYPEISREGYIGSQPTGIKIINKLDDFGFKKESGDGASGIHTTEAISKSEVELGGTEQVQPVYFYERFARPIDPDQTYVILRGSFGTDANETFYRIDLGYLRGGDDDPVGIFDYYNLLRNFDYVIKLNSVGASGYKTLEEAANGVVYNNFSASVEARTMNSISDGTDMIFVNHTSFVFLRPGQEIELLAQYREGINDGNGGTVNNDLLKHKYNTEDNKVIANITGPETVVQDGKNWNKYTVTGASNPGPTNDLQWETVYIYRGNKATSGEPDYGLYREITFYSHLPWPFLHIDTFPGLWMSPDDIPIWDMEDERYREIGHKKGSELTLFFELPAGIPQALFPMEFAIESDRQNIQNAYAGNAVVRSVPADESLFSSKNKKVGGTYSDWMEKDPTTTRIQYIKTVTWEEYNQDKSMGQAGAGSTIIRCRFLTITDLDQEGVGGTGTVSKSTTTLRVHNEHFGWLDEDGTTSTWRMYKDDYFTRDNQTSDPTPRIWDFSTSSDNTGLNMTGDTNYRDGYYDGVTSFSISHSYPGSDPRTAVLVITTDNNVEFSASVTGGTGVSCEYANENGIVPVDEGKYMHYIEINIPGTVTAPTITVTVPSTKKLYKIEFYPRGYDPAPEGTTP